MPHLLSREGKLRFNEVTWLNDLDLIKISNQRALLDGNNLLAQLIHNRRVVYIQEFLKHYFDHIKPSYLFATGDVNPRLSSQNVGQLYWVELPFMLVGLYFLLRSKNNASWLIFAWLILAPIPAALARETPHALRSENILPIPQLVIAYGILMLVLRLRSRINMKTALFVLSALYGISLSYYLNGYYKVYAQKYGSQWQDGYKQMVEYVKGVQDNYDYIYVTSDYGRPYIYLLFYEQTDPAYYWRTRNVNRDWYGFWYVYGFGKYMFTEPKIPGHWLIVDTGKQTTLQNNLLKTIYDSSGGPVFNVYEKTL